MFQTQLRISRSRGRKSAVMGRRARSFCVSSVCDSSPNTLPRNHICSLVHKVSWNSGHVPSLSSVQAGYCVMGTDPSKHRSNGSPSDAARLARVRVVAPPQRYVRSSPGALIVRHMEHARGRDLWKLAFRQHVCGLFDVGQVLHRFLRARCRCRRDHYHRASAADCQRQPLQRVFAA